MSGLPVTTQHEAGGLSREHASKLWQSRYFSLAWPTCGGAENSYESSSVPGPDEKYCENGGEESESPRARSSPRTSVNPGLQRTPTIQSRSSGSDHISAEPLSHPIMVVVRMEPEPEPIRMRGGGCCGGIGGDGGGARMRVDPSPHTKGVGVPPPTEKPNLRKASTPVGDDKPGKATQDTQPTQDTKPTKSMKSTKTAKSTKPAKPAKPTKPTKSTQPTNPAQTTQPVQLARTTNPPPLAQPVQTAEPARPAPTPQAGPTMPSIQPTQMIYSAQSTQSAQSAHPTQLTHTATTGASSSRDNLQPSQASLLAPLQSAAASKESLKTSLAPTGLQPQREPTKTTEGAAVLGQPAQQGAPAGTASRTSEPIPRLPPTAEAHRSPFPLPNAASGPKITSPAQRAGSQPVPTPPTPGPAPPSRRHK